ncbi:hypothetical protein CY34DRAFT_108502 [Suillus luteus UH-Slu-Lm8-n1]|uniref:Uncharacterized protein n=1 Tax=Suillus luteus UH-Slu-Lm8-n1 TaxID=930992 RepID=A0A0D0B4N1_9AGAM|nr:hypothetical protein CY34DRAFT_108502 [Suillus luteus UH-Slu-Lm8-n1]
MIPYNLEVSSYEISVCYILLPHAKKQVKCKSLEVSKPQPQPKKPQAVEVSSTPLVSLHLDGTIPDEPGRCSGHANVGTGGRNAQLEKIGVLLKAPSQALEPPYSKGRGHRPKVAPPPYSSSATIDDNIDLALYDIHLVELQPPKANISSDDDSNDNKGNKEDEEDEEKEISYQQID